MNPDIHAVAVALGLPRRRDQPRRVRTGNYGARALRQSHAAQFCERCECRFADATRDGKGYDAWREQVPGTRVCNSCQREIEVGHIISANPIAAAGYRVRTR